MAKNKANNPNYISNAVQPSVYLYVYNAMLSLCNCLNWPMQNFYQVAPLQKKIQKTVMADILAKSIAGKFLRKHPVASDKQAVSKL